jgi:hypothetical protein
MWAHANQPCIQKARRTFDQREIRKAQAHVPAFVSR